MSVQIQQIHAHKFYGESDGQVVVAWMNNTRRPRSDVIERLIKLNAQLGHLSAREIIKGHDVAGEIARLLRSTLKKYDIGIVPVLKDASAVSWDLEWRFRARDRMQPLQKLALVKLLYLSERGQLSQVRQCRWQKCKVWFFQRKATMFFHSQRCKQRHTRDTPEYRAAHAAAVQAARHAAKLRERKQLELSKSLKLTVRSKSQSTVNILKKGKP